MRKELDDRLVKEFPKIFKNRYTDMSETAMCWGFECGDGWYWLIRNLCAALQHSTDMNKRPQVIATQVKEKFGTLRFYVSAGTEPQFSLINFAEFLSGSICEKCGTTKNVEQTKGGWIQTLCTWCWEKEDDKLQKETQT